MSPARRAAGGGAATAASAASPAGTTGRTEPAMLRVTQLRSAIGTKPKHRGTLRALGLRRIGASNVLPDRPEIRGMLARVPHLVAVESAETSKVETSKEAES